MKSALVFGAGNIGRSFIGKAFAMGGWKVIFVDVDPGLVEVLNERKSYDVVVKRERRADEIISVGNVGAIDGRDGEAVSRAVIYADCLACCVGKSALPRILPNLAKGLIGRRETQKGPVDLILAENDREAEETVRRGLASLLPQDFPLASSLGLVQTSIGKMVPIMRAEDLAADRLRVFAEEYDSLIVDRHGFLNLLPDLPSLLPVENISAYVDRKLFVHNLGHAAVAWLGFSVDASKKLVSEAVDLPGVRESARFAMSQAADALALEYHADLSRSELDVHIDDLLERFSNSALRDTVFRVGRDLPRKLHRSDRVLGAACLCEKHGLPWGFIARTFMAALAFDARDEDGEAFPADTAFRQRLLSDGLPAMLEEVCKLDSHGQTDSRVLARLLSVAAPSIG
jgi:mannitol-1-phosphate 5-dehydrogenase